MKKTHEEFVAEIKDRSFIALEAYTGAKEKIRFRCDIDGYEWDGRPSNILNGAGCPKCGRRASSQKQLGWNATLEDHGDWILVDISTQKFPDATMACDKDVFEAHIANGRGRIFACKLGVSKNLYAAYATNIGGKNSRKVLFHRDVIDTPDGKMCDHITHYSETYTDNRRSNIRPGTKSENGMNRGNQSNNTSGMAGVVWDKSAQQWQVRIKVRGKQIYLGRFANIEIAMGVRKEAEREHFGEFAYQE